MGATPLQSSQTWRVGGTPKIQGSRQESKGTQGPASTPVSFLLGGPQASYCRSSVFSSAEWVHIAHLGGWCEDQIECFFSTVTLNLFVLRTLYTLKKSIKTSVRRVIAIDIYRKRN